LWWQGLICYSTTTTTTMVTTTTAVALRDLAAVGVPKNLNGGGARCTGRGLLGVKRALLFCSGLARQRSLEVLHSSRVIFVVLDDDESLRTIDNQQRVGGDHAGMHRPYNIPYNRGEYQGEP
jgi:hypothetical protein